MVEGMLLTLVVSVALSGAPKLDERLVGTWLAGGAPFVTFNANGSGTMEDGKVKWSADGKTLIVTDEDGEADKLAYVVDGATLTFNMGGMPVVLTKGGASSGKKGPLSSKVEKAAAPEATRPSGASKLAQLLLSSAWCSFRYNKVSGATNTSRYQFFRDGTWSTSARAETYNSGANGTVSGQYDSSNRGRWEVRNEQLYMSTPDEPTLQLVQGNITYNSNGSPIINADGQEFSSCN